VTQENWRLDLHDWAKQFANKVAQKPNVLGVVIGGSLGRGQEWPYSDLELGVLVESRDALLPYFNVNASRGVEIIQVIKPELDQQCKQVAAGDVTPVATWPIQLWKCQVVHDPTGMLKMFKEQFDPLLFTDEVLEKRIENLQFDIQEKLAKATILQTLRPAAALVEVRRAMNDLILVTHWAMQELPRSQNRTDSRLLSLCERHNLMPLYELYREVFALSNTNDAITVTWPKVRTDVLELTRLWGDSAHEFFVHAVDSEFQWGEDAGILTVYRLYIPIIGGEEQSLQQHLDNSDWIKKNTDWLDFLGLTEVKSAKVAEYIICIKECLEQLN
jgi:hypothetical protein